MKVLGIIIICLGIGIGLYLGLYVMLYGGIVQALGAISPLDVKELAIGIIKVLFCEIGWIPAVVGVCAGIELMIDD